MVLLRRFTRLGSKNKFALAGAVLIGYILFSKKGQETVAGGIPVVSGATQAFATGLERIIPIDIIGRELKGFGEGFKTFGVSSGEGISGLFAPVKGFIDYARDLFPWAISASAKQAQQDEEGTG